MKDERTLFDEIEPVASDGNSTAVGKTDVGARPAASALEGSIPSPVPTHQDLLREQVIRDYETLAMDEELIHPSVGFYVERIKSFRQTIAELTRG